MMLITQERTTLNKDKREIVIINPNIKFKAFELDEELIVTSSACIRSVETGEIITHLQAGQKIKGIGEVVKLKPKPRAKPTEG